MSVLTESRPFLFFCFIVPLTSSACTSLFVG